MARKSRKQTDAAVIDTRPAAKSYNVGAYVRLSSIDRKQKGDSIENQQAIIAAYCAEHAELVVREVYIDNGLSGQSFERPAFQRMLADLDSGKINTCISKDLSRLGRNAIDTGFYIEKYFPTHGIRYIAINDDYDSETSDNGLIVSLKNMVNENYALETGRKLHATKQLYIRTRVHRPHSRRKRVAMWLIMNIYSADAVVISLESRRELLTHANVRSTAHLKLADNLP